MSSPNNFRTDAVFLQAEVTATPHDFSDGVFKSDGTVTFAVWKSGASLYYAVALDQACTTWTDRHLLITAAGTVGSYDAAIIGGQLAVAYDDGTDVQFSRFTNILNSFDFELAQYDPGTAFPTNTAVTNQIVAATTPVGLKMVELASGFASVAYGSGNFAVVANATDAAGSSWGAPATTPPGDQGSAVTVLDYKTDGANHYIGGRTPTQSYVSETTDGAATFADILTAVAAITGPADLVFSASQGPTTAERMALTLSWCLMPRLLSRGRHCFYHPRHLLHQFYRRCSFLQRCYPDGRQYSFRFLLYRRQPSPASRGLQQWRAKHPPCSSRF